VATAQAYTGPDVVHPKAHPPPERAHCQLGPAWASAIVQVIDAGDVFFGQDIQAIEIQVG
jgi:hypothetical protein